MSQSTEVSLSPGVLHITLNLGSDADFREVSAQIDMLNAFKKLAESIAAPSMSENEAFSFARGLELPGDLSEFAGRLALVARYDRGPQEQMLNLVRLCEQAGARVTPDLVHSLARLMAGSTRVGAAFGLQLGRLNYNNPLEGWIDLAPAVLDRAAWVAHGGAALLLLRGLMMNLRYWQQSGRQLKLQDLEIEARRLELDEQRAFQPPAPATVRFEAMAVAELVELVRGAADGALTGAADARVGELLEEVRADPADALLRAGVEDVQKASAATQLIAEVVDAELKN